MTEDDRKASIAWLFGACALAAWFTLLWFMFSDVL